MKILTTILIVVAFSITKLHAQDEPRQAINICAVAIPVMNMYVVNYEYLYHERHGLATRIEYVPNLKGADNKGTAWAAVLDYRWHFLLKQVGTDPAFAKLRLAVLEIRASVVVKTALYCNLQKRWIKQ